MSEKLKPCPFCGCDDVGIWYDEENFDGYQIFCEGCGGMSNYFDTPEEARAAWNRGTTNAESKNNRPLRTY